MAQLRSKCQSRIHLNLNVLVDKLVDPVVEMVDGFGEPFFLSENSKRHNNGKITWVGLVLEAVWKPQPEMSCL